MQFKRFNCQVVFLDIAARHNEKDLPIPLQQLFKHVGYPANDYGIFLYQLMVAPNIMNVYEFVDRQLGLNWEEINMILFNTHFIKEFTLKKEIVN